MKIHILGQILTGLDVRKNVYFYNFLILLKYLPKHIHFLKLPLLSKSEKKYFTFSKTFRNKSCLPGHGDHEYVFHFKIGAKLLEKLFKNLIFWQCLNHTPKK